MGVNVRTTSGPQLKDQEEFSSVLTALSAMVMYYLLNEIPESFA